MEPDPTTIIALDLNLDLDLDWDEGPVVRPIKTDLHVTSSSLIQTADLQDLFVSCREGNLALLG